MVRRGKLHAVRGGRHDSSTRGNTGQCSLRSIRRRLRLLRYRSHRLPRYRRPFRLPRRLAHLALGHWQLMSDQSFWVELTFCAHAQWYASYPLAGL
jgi:hypothetical protein